MTTPIDPIAATRLVGRYCDAVARFDVDAFAGLWAEDAVWHIAGGDDRHGRAAIVALFREARGVFRLCLQEILSSVVHADGRVRSYVRELQWREEGAASQLIGAYDDVLTAPADDPLFAARRFTALYRGPLDGSGRLFDPARLDAPLP